MYFLRLILYDFSIDNIREINFSVRYKDLLLQKKKTTTVRLGDRRHQFKVGDIVRLVIANSEEVGKGRIVSVAVKKLKDVNDKDLVGESSDCRTKELLMKVLSEAYFSQLERPINDEDIVTVIHWEYV